MRKSIKSFKVFLNSLLFHHGRNNSKTNGVEQAIVKDVIVEEPTIASSTTPSEQDVPTIVQDAVTTDIANESDFIRKQTYSITTDALIIGASIRGKSHIESGTECQDYHLYEQLADGWYVMLVSDGAGSAKFAARGSKANCNISLQLLKEILAANQWIENNVFPTELQWYIECRSMFEKMKLIYRSKAKEANDDTEETDFNATIILCLITPRGMLTAHIGDGRMGYLSQNGEWKSLMIPHKGEEANQTLFLQNSWTYPQTPALTISGVTVPETRVVPEIPEAVVLISDGCERATWECSIMDNSLGKYVDLNLPHPPYMNPLIGSILEEKTDERLNLFIDILDRGTDKSQQERDDKTMLLFVNTKFYDLSNNISGENHQN